MLGLWLELGLGLDREKSSATPPIGLGLGLGIWQKVYFFNCSIIRAPNHINNYFHRVCSCYVNK